MLPHQVPVHSHLFSIGAYDLKAVRRRCQRPNAPIAGRGARAESLAGRPQTAGQDPVNRFRIPPDDQTLPRDTPNQVMKLGLDGSEVGKNIGVVELQITDNQGARAVVNKFGSLVEEGRVVFIGLDHEEIGLTQSSRLAEIPRHAANQKTGGHPAVFQNPCQHAGCRGFAVGTGHGEYPASRQHLLTQPLGTRNIGQSRVQYRLYLRVTTGQGITQYDQVRLWIDVARSVTLHQFNTGLGKLVTHGRIDVGVRTGNPVTLCPGQQRQATHEGAANTDNMNVLCQWKLSGRLAWICTSSPRALPYAPQLSPTGTRSAPKTMSKANAFYAQSGGVTPVINASACGVIETAAQYKDLIGKVYAGRNGIVGALREDLIDTSKESKKAIRGLMTTPAGAFGSCRYKLRSLEENRAEYERLIAVFNTRIAISSTTEVVTRQTPA